MLGEEAWGCSARLVKPPSGQQGMGVSPAPGSPSAHPVVLLSCVLLHPAHPSQPQRKEHHGSHG